MTIVCCEIPNVGLKEIQDEIDLIDEDIFIDLTTLIREKKITRLRALAILISHPN